MFDKNEELINVIDPESLLENTQVQELNGLITTVVSAPYSKELEEAFYVGSRDVDDNNIFWLYKVDKRTNDNSNLIIEGTYVLFDELKAYDLIRDKRPSNATALTGINAILDGCRWQVGNITSTHTGTANWYYVSRLEAFWEYLENWNVEFKPRMTFSKGKITGRYIDIVDKLSDDYGKWYEYGDKLLHITAEHASNSLYTAFIGRGKGEEVGEGYGRRIGFNDVVWSVGAGHPVDKPLGQDYVEIPSATEMYGYSDGKPRTTVVTFEDTEDATLLLEQTYAYALNECRPKLQMKADVLETGLSELGETCTIIRDDIGIRYKTRVFKLTRDFLNKNKKTVEFGDEIVQSTAKRNNNVAKVIKKQEERTIAWLDAIQQQLLDTYFNEDGYNYDLKAGNEYDLPGGFYSFNAPIDQNPTKLIYMGAGSLAIANSKNPDGSWNFRTWGTGDGFTADLINAGVLQGGNMRHDLNAGESTYTDPNTGDILRLKQGEIEFQNGSQGRFLRYNAEGLVFDPFPSNTGTSRNTMLRLQGGGNGSFQYIQFSEGGANNRQQRLEAVDGNLRLKVASGGVVEIMDYITENYASLILGTVETRHAAGFSLIIAGNSIETPRDGARDIRIAPNGTGIVKIANAADDYYNIRASTFLNSSSRKLKTNIVPSEINALEIIDSLTVVEYNLKKDLKDGVDNKQIGFIAEDSPSISSADEESIDSYKLSTLSAKAIQELNAENKALKEELQEIKQHLGLA